MDEGFTAIVRGAASKLPRGYLWLIPVWLAVTGAALGYAWYRIASDPPPLWYGALAIPCLVLACVTLLSVISSIRHLAYRADASGIRLGVRTTRKRPRQRQVHLWWADVQQLAVLPRRYGLLLEITLGPGARLVRRRGLLRQGLLMCGMLILPVGLGRGTPQLTEPRRNGPQYRVRLCDVTPEELGIAMASLAPAEVEIIVMSRLRRPLLTRRPLAVTSSAA